MLAAYIIYEIMCVLSIIGGTSKAIVKAGGQTIVDECKKLSKKLYHLYIIESADFIILPDL